MVSEYLEVLRLPLEMQLGWCFEFLECWIETMGPRVVFAGAEMPLQLVDGH